MRSSTKLKRLLESNVVAFSLSNESWEVTVIDNKTKKRIQAEGKNFTDVIGKAFKIKYHASPNSDN